MKTELYDYIYDALTELIDVETEEKSLFVHKITSLATKGAEQYLEEVEEALVHLKETVKRLTRES